jgi:VIT1/CCC1 family predicted Fe2+/Mn2+ transporter
MQQASKPSSLTLVNFITGMSDGLLLPFGVYLLLLPVFAASFNRATAISLMATLLAAFVFGWARYLGEQKEIQSNHPELAALEAAKEKELMLHIGITAALTDDMQSQMETERNVWLKEVVEHEMGWEKEDYKRARRSGLQTASGFLSGSICMLAILSFSLKILHIPLLFIWLGLTLQFIFGFIKGYFVGKSILRLSMLHLALGLAIAISAVFLSCLIPFGHQHLWNFLFR